MDGNLALMSFSESHYIRFSKRKKMHNVLDFHYSKYCIIIFVEDCHLPEIRVYWLKQPKNDHFIFFFLQNPFS